MAKWEYAILRDTKMPPDRCFLSATASTAHLLECDMEDIAIAGGHVSSCSAIRYLYSRSKNIDAVAFMAAHRCVVLTPHNDGDNNLVCRRIIMNINNNNIKSGRQKVLRLLVKRKMQFIKQAYFRMKTKLAICVQQLVSLKQSHNCDGSN